MQYIRLKIELPRFATILTDSIEATEDNLLAMQDLAKLMVTDSKVTTLYVNGNEVFLGSKLTKQSVVTIIKYEK